MNNNPCTIDSLFDELFAELTAKQFSKVPPEDLPKIKSFLKGIFLTGMSGALCWQAKSGLPKELLGIEIMLTVEAMQKKAHKNEMFGQAAMQHQQFFPN